MFNCLLATYIVAGRTARRLTTVTSHCTTTGDQSVPGVWLDTIKNLSLLDSHPPIGTRSLNREATQAHKQNPPPSNAKEPKERGRRGEERLQRKSLALPGTHPPSNAWSPERTNDTYRWKEENQSTNKSLISTSTQSGSYMTITTVVNARKRVSLMSSQD